MQISNLYLGAMILYNHKLHRVMYIGKDKAEAKKNNSFLRFENNTFREFNKELDLRFEFILRYCVTPPIKGPITKGKIKWRGITKEVTYNTCDRVEEGKLICNTNLVVKQRGVPVSYSELHYQVWKDFHINHTKIALLGDKNYNGKGLLEQIHYD